MVLHRTRYGVSIGTFLLFVATAVSAQTSGGIALRGFVPPVLSVSIAPERGAMALDLSVDVTEVRLGAVVTSSNSNAGYTVTVESENAVFSASDIAFFRSDDGVNTDTLSYTVSYGGTPLALDGGLAEVRASGSPTGPKGDTDELAISYEGAHASLRAGPYSDTLVITISAP